MRLYLDDVRPTPEGFDLRAYTAWEAIDLLASGAITHVSFDHDLGPFNETGTGYDVTVWIETTIATQEIPYFPMPTWEVHSDNPVGRKNIIRAMESAQRWYDRWICYRSGQLGCNEI